MRGGHLEARLGAAGKPARVPLRAGEVTTVDIALAPGKFHVADAAGLARAPLLRDQRGRDGLGGATR